MIFEEVATGKRVKASNYVELFAFSHNSNYVLVNEDNEITKKQEIKKDKKGKRETKKQEAKNEVVDVLSEEVVEDNEITEEQGEVIQ